MGEEREGAGGNTAYQVGAIEELIILEEPVLSHIDDLRETVLFAQGD